MPRIETSPATPPLPPGPKSFLPRLLNVRQRRRGLLANLRTLAETHGDIAFFRMFGRRFCVVSDPELIRTIVVADDARFTKSHALVGAKRVLGEGLLTSEGEIHRRQRRLIAPAFHAQQIKTHARTFVDHAKRTSDAWADGGTVNIVTEMTQLTLRVVTKALFDAELSKDARQIGEDMSTIVEMFERTRSPLAPLLNRLPLPANRRFERALARLDIRIDDMIEARRREDPPADQRFDLLSLLLAARDQTEDGGMSDRQVRDEAVTLFMAGHETTANALVWTWLLLAEHPEAEAQLHTELDRVLDGRDAAAEHARNLAYTRAVISESMRLRPPAWVIARQAIDAYDLGGYRVPAGTTILMSQYLVHRDPRWWPEPEVFRPERWLEPAPDRPKYAYFPFGGGPRSCVGEPFAWLESTLLLATLAQRWTLRRTDATPVELLPTITLRPKRPIAMMTRRRAP